MSFAEDPQTWEKIFAKTVWIFPAAFSQERSSYVPRGRRRMGTLWVWVGSAPRGIAAFVLQGLHPTEQVRPCSKFPYTRTRLAESPPADIPI